MRARDAPAAQRASQCNQSSDSTLLYNEISRRRASPHPPPKLNANMRQVNQISAFN